MWKNVVMQGAIFSCDVLSLPCCLPSCKQWQRQKCWRGSSCCCLCCQRDSINNHDGVAPFLVKLDHSANNDDATIIKAQGMVGENCRAWGDGLGNYGNEGDRDYSGNLVVSSMDAPNFISKVDAGFLFFSLASFFTCFVICL